MPNRAVTTIRTVHRTNTVTLSPVDASNSQSAIVTTVSRLRHLPDSLRSVDLADLGEFYSLVAKKNSSRNLY